MDINQPSYYAIIPANIRYAKISPNAKLLYGEITCLSNKDGYCWASNPHFARLYGVDKRTITRWVKELVDIGAIHYEVTEGYRRRIYLGEGRTKMSIDNNIPHDRQNCLHNITSINTKNNTLSLGADWLPSIEQTKTISQATGIPVMDILEKAPGFAGYYAGQEINNPAGKFQNWLINDQARQAKKVVN